MIKADKYFKDNLHEIITNGSLDINPRPKYKDGTAANSKFITQVFEKYDIDKGEFPLITLRNTAIKMGIKEILWIYQMQSNSLSLANEMGINWWDEWNIGDGTIGQRYGYTVKRYDLTNKLLRGLENDPFSRRHFIELLQEDDIKTPGLFPCAHLTEWSVRNVDGIYYVDQVLIQRSNDYIMAGCINKIQYVAFLMMVVGHLNSLNNGNVYKVGTFSHYTNNLHIYDRHIEAAIELINKEPLDIQPSIILNSNKNFYEYTINDFEIKNILGITKISAPLEIAI